MVRQPCALTAGQVHQQIVSAWRAKDWERLRMLIHPAGSFQMIAAGGRLVGAEEFVERMIAADSTVFGVDDLAYTALSEEFLLVTGSAREPLERGHRVSRVVWLVEVRDEMAYGSSPFRSKEAALAEYERQTLEAARR